ncbi:hypothetical protein CCACVL1_29080 [Corchorus capsularis]|uniref:Uncharacterized protein n=1 Tax=Corchorus capsularis TaxID=210143 RepID=A0A1R3G409_COCAP|nr:hypothetical protein CCACVL1_29080 [Corchorus capsularis]
MDERVNVNGRATSSSMASNVGFYSTSML